MAQRLTAPPVSGSGTASSVGTRSLRWMSGGHQDAVAAVVLCALVLAAFLRFVDAQWAGTDSLTLAVSNRVRSLGELLQLFVIPVMPGTSFSQGEIIYRPAASVTFALDGLVWGINPVGFHVTNVLLHLATTLGVFALARRLGASRVAASVGAGVFALHPAMVATIPVIARRDNVVSAAPLVWSLVLLTGSPSRVRYVAALALFAVALLAKESGFAALPLVPLALLATRSHACTWRAYLPMAIRLSLPFAVLWAALFGARWLVLGSLGGYVNAPVGRLDVHASVVLLTSFARYLLWVFTAVLPADSRAWLTLGALMVVAVPVLAWRLSRRPRCLMLFGWSWALLFAAFFVVVRTLSGAWLLYYPLVGVGVVLAGVVDAARLEPRWTRVASATVATVFIASVAATTPLVVPYPEWRVVGQTSAAYLDAAVACLANAPDGTHVQLDQPPGFLNLPSGRNDLLVPVLVADYTVASALEVAYPEKRFTITDNGFVDITDPSKLNVTCSTNGPDRVVHTTS